MWKRHPRNRGFTIFELMITIAVAGVLAAVAIPNMRDFIRNGRLTSATNDLLRSMQIARSEAIKRQRNVVVCATDSPSAEVPACSYDTFRGWIVFQDSNANWSLDGDDPGTPDDEGEAIIERHDLLDDSLTVLTDNDAILSYAASGFANPPSSKSPSKTVVVCDSRGNKQLGNDSTARALVIEDTGRTRATRVHTDVSTAITKVGGSCP
jgi:type IV fimbrial biogenesis protein FimT